MGQPVSPAVAVTTATALRLTDVVKSFGAVRALKGVSLEVSSGEIHALVGENGAGKSTLMSVASGATPPDSGTIEFCGEVVSVPTPAGMRSRGLGVVYQHPALLPDLTVEENLLLSADPDSKRPRVRDRSQWTRNVLGDVSGSVRPADRVSELTVQQRHLVEIARALAARPRVLILDEPTEPLVTQEIDWLFEQVRAAADQGTAVIYISHRIPDIQRIADRVTVLRDGETRGTFAIDEVSEEDIVRLIVGREVAYVLPQKPPSPPDGDPIFEVRGLTRSPDFVDVNLKLLRGEIVGLAGISGSGQEEFMRALAGLGKSTGEVVINGRPWHISSPQKARAARVAYIPSDRKSEGILAPLDVQENLALGAVRDYATVGVVSPSRERARVVARAASMALRAPSLRAPVTALSGGNQQKVVLGRALERDPEVLLADEPTQGVDVGARAEIYLVLRQSAAEGKTIILASSDAVELAGLCDRVLVFSRGHVVSELRGDEVNELAITNAALTSTSLRDRGDEDPASHSRLGRFLRGDYAPSVALIALIIALAAYTQATNNLYLSGRNIGDLLVQFTGLAFIAYGQQMVMLVGGIDLSVGPLSGLLVVIASFYFIAGASVGTALLGIVLFVGCALAVGLLHFLLIRKVRIPPVATTLATYIALQGVSFILRPDAAGSISSSLITTIDTSIGVIPIAFIVAVALAVALEIWLRYFRAGIQLRAVGSDEAVSFAAGARVTRSYLIAYVSCTLLVLLGAIMLMAQTGVGDPQGGITFTLSSVVAVVLGGAALTGGRGSFIGVLFGALLLQESTNMTPFLNLSQQWTSWIPGGLILVAAGLYSVARQRGSMLS
jgi:ribose transport system ATP-binding protein